MQRRAECLHYPQQLPVYVRGVAREIYHKGLVERWAQGAGLDISAKHLLHHELYSLPNPDLFHNDQGSRKWLQVLLCASRNHLIGRYLLH